MNNKKMKLYALMISTLSVLFVFFGVQNVKAATTNDYIINYRMQPAQIVNREGTFSVWEGYENGVGKPEGVVIHETATPGASAELEALSFNNNWQTYQSYVHAFVDANEILNIHNTDYIVWGAGPTANYKFIQVELCRETTYDAFARSVANQAYYAASKLLQYGLPDVPGVTVMSHHQVSQKWGETTHVDPDTYFAPWGYNMDLMNQLISYYYNNLKNTGSPYGGNGTANTNGGANNAGVQDNNVIKVNNTQGGYVPLVAFTDNGSVHEVTNRALANNTPWYTDQTRDFGGVTYHRVATNEWVASNYIA